MAAISAVSTLVTTTHHHPLPVCTGAKHDRSCKKFKREADCKRVRIIDPNTRKATEFANCIHFYIK